MDCYIRLIRLQQSLFISLFAVCHYSVTHKLRRTVAVAVYISPKAFIGNVHITETGEDFFGAGIVVFCYEILPILHQTP